MIAEGLPFSAAEMRRSWRRFSSWPWLRWTLAKVMSPTCVICERRCGQRPGRDEAGSGRICGVAKL